MKLLVFAALITSCLSTQHLPLQQVQQSSIINTDGTYSFSFDNNRREGRQFRDETRNADGTVVGKYGFQDPTGQLRIVQYTAGKDGFIATGDDIHVQQSPGIGVPVSGVGVPIVASVAGQPIVWNSNNAEQQGSIVAVDPSLQYANRQPVKGTLLSTEQQKSQVEDDNDEVKVKVQQQSESVSDRDDTFPQVLSGQRRLTDPVVDVPAKKVSPQVVDGLISGSVNGVPQQIVYQSVPVVQQQTVPVIQQQSIPVVHQQTAPVVSQPKPVHTSLLSSLVNVPTYVVREIKHHRLDHDSNVPQVVGQRQVVHTLVQPVVHQVVQQQRDQQVVQPIVQHTNYGVGQQLGGLDQTQVAYGQPASVQQVGDVGQTVVQTQPLNANVDQRQQQVHQVQPQQYGVHTLVNDQRLLQPSYIQQQGSGLVGLEQPVAQQQNVQQVSGLYQPSVVQQVGTIPYVWQPVSSLGASDPKRVIQQQHGVHYQQLVPIVDRNDGVLEERVVLQPQSFNRVRVEPYQSVYVTNPWASRVSNIGLVGNNVPLRQSSVPLLSGGVQQQQWYPQQYPVTGFQTLSPYQVLPVRQQVTRPVQQVWQLLVQPYGTSSGVVQPYGTSSGVVQPLQYSNIQDLSIRRVDDSGVAVKPEDSLKSVVVIDVQGEPKPALYSHQLATKSVAV